MNHLIPVAQGQLTKLNWKHIKLTPQTKMSVKRAVTVCSLDVALDILKGPLPPEEKKGYSWNPHLLKAMPQIISNFQQKFRS